MKGEGKQPPSVGGREKPSNGWGKGGAVCGRCVGGGGKTAHTRVAGEEEKQTLVLSLSLSAKIVSFSSLSLVLSLSLSL